MSILPSESTPSTCEEPLANFLFDYPGADIILLSQDKHRLRVPKLNITQNSPVLNELIQRISDPGNANVGASLPTVQLPESGTILRHLLTFILPVSPTLPRTHEETMELLYVAQKYQMESVLVHIRGFIARQNPLPTHLEPALHIYALAQKYGLRQEALQTSQIIVKQWMTIEDFGDKLNTVPGTSLYELWQYYERVRTVLTLDLTEFRESGAHGTISGLKCTALSTSQTPLWLDQYIESIAKTPKLFQVSELTIAMACHIKNNANELSCKCASIPSQTIDVFWEALSSVVYNTFENAESALSLVQEREDARSRINPAISPLDPSDLSDANIVIRSSDFVNFKVHKHVLAVASPVFKDLLSLRQPPDSESVDGLPVVQLSEDSELLSALVSILYHLHSVIPTSYDKVLYLLATCQKYEMVSVQSYIRAEVKHGVFPRPNGAEAFSAYAIASSKGLVLEMENTACQTLDHPMTFEVLGEGLRLFEGWALRDLANYRRRYRDHLVLCIESFLKTQGSSVNIWTPCAFYTYHPAHSSNQCQYGVGQNRSAKGSYSRSTLSMSNTNQLLPSWLAELFQQLLNESREAFSRPLFNPRNIRGEYLSALKDHLISHKCVSCSSVHSLNGETFCKKLEDRLAQTLNEVSRISSYLSHLTHPNYPSLFLEIREE